jgi:hypothetical protein
VCLWGTDAYPDTDAQYGGEGEEEEEKKAPDVAMVASKKLSEQELKDRGMATVFRRDDAVLKRKTTDKREMEAGFVSENYTECYPGYASCLSSSAVGGGLPTEWGGGIG